MGGNLDLNELASLKQLRRLTIRDRPSLETIAPLSELKNLEVLIVSRTGVRDFSPVSNMPGLLALCARQNIVEKMPSFENQACIEILDFGDSSITYAGTFKNLHRLKFLSFDCHPDSSLDLADVGDLPEIQYLLVGHANITGTHLQGCDNLTLIAFTECQIDETLVEKIQLARPGLKIETHKQKVHERNPLFPN